MLKQGETGNDILMILNAITSDSVSETEPTLEEIAFWYNETLFNCPLW